MSKIEWTDVTWNPITGCTKVSEGCRNCYADRMHGRFSNRPFGEVTIHSDRMKQPDHWRKPRAVFVCSMGDLYHKDVPVAVILDVFDVMRRNPQHTFIVLTKRADRMPQIAPYVGAVLPNVVLGVSVEDQRAANDRVLHLLQTPAARRIVSYEPALGQVDFWCLNDGSWYDAEGAELYNALSGTAYWRNGDHGLGGGPKLDGVICGGESGPGARPMDLGWARSMRDQCSVERVPFFFKQWGEYIPHGMDCRRVGKKAAGRILDGRTHDDLPWTLHNTTPRDGGETGGET